MNRNKNYYSDKGEQFATFYNMLLRAEDAEERETTKRKTADWKKRMELQRIKTARELDCDRIEYELQIIVYNIFHNLYPLAHYRALFS